MQYIFVYITAKDKEQALAIGRSLVAERLAACANILDGMQSVYWWEGKICEDNETVCIAKTRQDLLEQVVAQVKRLHSYSCPCVVALPVTGGNPQYLEWLGNETEK